MGSPGLLRGRILLIVESELLIRLEVASLFEAAGAQVPAVVRELRWRKVLTEPKLVPRYLGSRDTRSRLERVSKGVEPLDLIEAPESSRGRRETEHPESHRKESP